MKSNVLAFPVVEKTAETLLARLESQAEALEEKYVLAWKVGIMK